MQNKQAEDIFLAWKAYHLAALPLAAVESFNRLFASWMMFNSIYGEQDQLTGNLPQNPTERDKVESFEDNSAFGAAHTNLLATNQNYANAVNFIINRSIPRPAQIPVACESPNVEVWNLNPAYQTAAKQGLCTGALIEIALFKSRGVYNSTLGPILIKVGVGFSALVVLLPAVFGVIDSVTFSITGKMLTD